MGKRCNFPILSIGAEYYAMAMLMRRNIMTFKAEVAFKYSGKVGIEKIAKYLKIAPIQKSNKGQ